ncbi:MAG: 50S ribosomal protein L10 [bacterium]
MDKTQKTKLVGEIKEKFEKARGVIMTDYKGLSVKDISELRKKLQEASCEYRVLKNTLTGIAIKDMGLDGIKDFLTGPTAIAFGYGDPVASAKVLSDFKKEHEIFNIKAGILGEKIISQDDIKFLANLPDRNTLLSMVLSGMQSPIRGIATVLQGPIRGLVTVLDAIQKQKGNV